MVLSILPKNIRLFNPGKPLLEKNAIIGKRLEKDFDL